MTHLSRRQFLGASAAALAARRSSQGAVRSEAGVRHSFLVFGARTFLQSEDDETVWEWPENTRDGWMLPNGNLLLVITRVRNQHGGRLVEVTRTGETVFRFDGTQDEINTCQPLPDGRILLTEAGKNPRLLEIDRQGKTQFELPLDCQTENIHLQSRMTRKLASGNYLVPLMGEKEVRELTPDGKIAWRAATRHWPFSALRLPDGNTLVSGTQAHEIFTFDGEGKEVDALSNEDLPGEPLHGLCGAQRLTSGNIVQVSYQVRDEGRAKINEISPDGRIVWSYWDDSPHGAHHVQILTTNGKPEAWPMLR